MKKILITLCFVSIRICMSAQSQSGWSPAGDKLKTPWAEKVNPTNPLPEYPRPQLTRLTWENLNGLWDYAITGSDDLPPIDFDGKILVPFCIESSLSGVMKSVSKNDVLWYRRSFVIPSSWKGKDVLLHFGAVDHDAKVYVNGKLVACHSGGYTGFSANITSTLKYDSSNTLTVRVFDPTDEQSQPLGKQRRYPGNPGTIWYTSVTGIWQTVWMEPVSRQHIEEVKTTPDLDNNRFLVDVKTIGAMPANNRVEVELTDDGNRVASASAPVGSTIILDVKKPKLWTPDSPFRYQMRIKLTEGGSVVDEAGSYTAMRKVSIGSDKGSFLRLKLNDTSIFHFGPLDQGYWPDGLYTAPTDEALLYDVIKTKEWGYNTIRKHMKVEPARWYYFCDSIGLMVWQDMPSLGRSDERWDPGHWCDQVHGRHSSSVEAQFQHEWGEIIHQLYSYPCIVVWTPFNEAWGQFKTSEIIDFTRIQDPTRLINPASGGNHYRCGDFLDLHDYARPPRLFLTDDSRPVVLGEYGGLGRHIPGHRWYEADATTYVNYGDASTLTDSYIEQGNAVLKMAKGITIDGKPAAFSAAIYTQTTDVETEVNGLMTYDRLIVKMDEARIKEINNKISHSLEKK